MLATALKAIIVITVLLGGWMLVQAAWRRVFPDRAVDEDVMAGRLGCHQCPCDAPCERPGSETPNQPEE